MATYPTEFSNEYVNLHDISNMSDRGVEAVHNLQQRGLEIVSGIQSADLGQILELASRPDVMEFCPNDGKRFGTEPDKWIAKGRGGFLLRDIEDNTIVGYSWVGTEITPELPDHTETTAFRSPIYKGTGKDLVIATVEAARAIHGSSMLGLETWASNPAVKTYTHPRVGALLVNTRTQEPDKETGAMGPVRRPTIKEADAPDAVMINGIPHIRDTRLFMVFPEPQPLPGETDLVLS
jgi:hypothetical protein